MIVRPKTPQDRPDCAAVLLAVHRTDGWPRYLPPDVDRFVTPPYEDRAWVAEQDEGRLVGHVALHVADADPTLAAARRATGLPPERLAVMARLFVSPDARRQGIAVALVEVATSAARARGQTMVLDVVQDAVAAVALYERLGWRRVEPMRLELGAAVLDLWVYLGPG